MNKRNLTGHRIGAWHGMAKHSDALVIKSRKLRESGMTYKQIGSALNVNWRTVCDWVNYATRYDA